MTDTGTWHASSIDLVQQQVVEHIWKVELPGLDPSRATMPAWDIEVTLDGSRSPYATASFKAPAGYIAETPDGAGTVFTKLTPATLPPVRVWAGWRHVIDGVLVDDLQILFSGQITTRKLIVEEGKTYVQFTAQTAETGYQFPSNRTYNVIDTHTTVKESTDAINVAGTPWYRQIVLTNETAWMNTPTAGQLTNFRNTEIAIDDDVMDFIRQLAASLGQWVRGDVRAATPGLIISADPWPYREALTLPAAVFTRIERTDDLDSWANILKLTMSWTDASGNGVSKKKTFIGNGVTPGTGAIRARDVTISNYPRGGTISATDPLALAWLKRVQDWAEVGYLAQGRAIWWLQPRIHGVQVPDLGLADTAGPLNAVTFQVDSGTMTLAWATNNTR